MIPVELFDLDEIVKFGDPYHGKLTVSSGVVEAPDAATFSLHGEAPSELGLTQRLIGGSTSVPAGPARIGECYLFNPKGVTPSQAADGEGLTWLSYGLLAGAQRRVFGKNLGVHTWLYKAEDGTIWSVEVVTWNLYKPESGSWSMAPVIKLKRYGVIGVPGTSAAEQTIALGGMTVPSYGDLTDITKVIQNYYMAVEDIRVDGSGAMFCLQSDYSPVGDVRQRIPGVILELQISGTPPSASVAVVTIASSDIPTVGESYSSSYGTMVTYATDDPAQKYYPSFTESFTRSIVCGARYKPDGVTPELIRMRISASITRNGSYSYAASVRSASGTATISGTASFCHGDIDFTSFSFSGSASYAYDATWSGGVPSITSSLDYSMTVAGTTFSDTIGVDGLTVEESGIVPVTDDDVLCPVPLAFVSNGMAFASPQGFGLDPVTYNKAIVYFARRYTNSVWGMVRNRSWVSQLRYLAVYGKIGSNTDVLDIALTDPQPIFCSEHPVSGEILRGTAGNVFV